VCVRVCLSLYVCEDVCVCVKMFVFFLFVQAQVFVIWILCEDLLNEIVLMIV